MKRKKGAAKSMKPESGEASVRATITFPPELYATLEEIAKQKKVSLAWVVRDAAEQYLAEKWPLFRKQA
jgi:metal-responsive CopG/Arc/MetJ family transcriptional regulator